MFLLYQYATKSSCCAGVMKSAVINSALSQTVFKAQEKFDACIKCLTITNVKKLGKEPSFECRQELFCIDESFFTHTFKISCCVYMVCTTFIGKKCSC